MQVSPPPAIAAWVRVWPGDDLPAGEGLEVHESTFAHELEVCPSRLNVCHAVSVGFEDGGSRDVPGLAKPHPCRITELGARYVLQGPGTLKT